MQRTQQFSDFTSVCERTQLPELHCASLLRAIFSRAHRRVHIHNLYKMVGFCRTTWLCERQLQARNQGGARQGCVRTPHCYQEPIARSVQTSLVKTPLHEHMEV